MRLFTRKQPTRILACLVHILRNNVVSFGLTKSYVLTIWIVRRLVLRMARTLARERWLTSEDLVKMVSRMVKRQETPSRHVTSVSSQFVTVVTPPRNSKCET